MLFRLCLAAILAATLLPAQWRPFGGRDRRSGNGEIERAISDLRRAESRNRVDHHERSHFRRAIDDLSDARQHWSREGRIDERRLDSALDNMRDLARADQVHPRDRQMIAGHIRTLQRLSRRW